VRPYYQRNLRCTGATVDKYFPCEPAAVAVAVRSNSTKHDPRKGTSACRVLLASHRDQQASSRPGFRKFGAPMKTASVVWTCSAFLIY